MFDGNMGLGSGQRTDTIGQTIMVRRKIHSFRDKPIIKKKNKKKMTLTNHVDSPLYGVGVRAKDRHHWADAHSTTENP
jgi:hypothetical protein